MILQVPAPTAVTNPEDAFTVAKAVFELDHVPPASPLEEYVSVAPMHNGELPLITPAEALGLTVTAIEVDTGDPQVVTV